MRNHYRVLSEALEYAVDIEVIEANPADRVKPQIVTAEMVELILAQAVGTPWLAAFCLAVYTGIRRSELCGLRWRDVDLEKYYLTIDRARVAVTGGSVEGDPKSESSSRLISLSTDIVYVLRYHLMDQLEMFEALGIQWKEDCHMFCNDRGEPYHSSSVTHAFKRFATRSGFPDVRLHDTRHAHATILLRAKVQLKVVQEGMGHSTIATMSDIYSHVLREMDVDAAEAFERQFDDVR
ncbi:MAG: site-specific integrase [Dehalococcoidia bacterium]|nr:site-specific integrase [Dehalococcoidia bacterium]